MSWSFSAIGSPKAIQQAFERSKQRYTGTSREEMEKAQPAITQLLELNFGMNRVMRLDASGHAYIPEPGAAFCSVVVTLQDIGTLVVEEPGDLQAVP